MQIRLEVKNHKLEQYRTVYATIKRAEDIIFALLLATC